MLKMSVAELNQFIESEFPQIVGMGIKIEALEPNRLRARLPIGYDNLRPGGTVSGPTMMTLVDATVYFLIMARIGPKPLAVTTNLNINFLRKPKVADLLIDVSMLKLGRRLAIGEGTIFSDGNEDDPVAHATLTYAIPD